MMNLSGKPVIAFKDGLWQFGWYRGCSRPLVDGERFLSLNDRKSEGKLGGTARKEKLVPWDVFSFCVSWRNYETTIQF